MKTKRFCGVLLIMLCILTSAYSYHDSSVLTNKISKFVKQTESVREPTKMCFPTSMVNAALFTEIEFPKSKSRYNNIVDIYDEFLHSDVIKKWCNSVAPSYVKTYLSWGTDIRELWEVEYVAFNKWVGRDVCELNVDIGKYDLLSILDKGGVVVMSGTFAGFNHVVCIVGYETDPINPELITNILFNDPFGDPYTKYETRGEGGELVRMPFYDFWQCTYKPSYDEKKHIGIVFRNEVEEKYGSQGNPATRYDIQENYVNTISTLLDASLSSYSDIHIDGSTTPTSIDPKIWYYQYVKYMLDIGDYDEEKELISYHTYLQYADYWSEYIPVKFLFVLINESLKHDIPMNYLYAVSRIETMNFVYFESLVANNNGSIDYGLMGLNYNNINGHTDGSKYFLNSYFYYDNEFDHFDKHNQVHNAKTGSMYLKDLLTYTGNFKDAAICYNGGIGRWVSNKPAAAAVKYGNLAVKYSNVASEYDYKSSGILSIAKLRELRELSKLTSYNIYSIFNNSIKFDKLYDRILLFKSNDWRLHIKYVMDKYIPSFAYIKRIIYCEVIVDKGILIGQVGISGKYMVL